MTRDEIQADLRDFLAEDAGVDAAELTADAKLFTSRLLDSLDILNIVAFIEKTYGVSVGTWEVSLERFDTLSGISGFVESKLA